MDSTSTSTSPASPAALVRASLLEVFGERDTTRRKAAAARIFAPDVVFRDAEGEVVGLDALVGKAGGLLESAPADWVFGEDGPAAEIADLGRAAWMFGPAAGPAAVHGSDIVLVEDGVIHRLYTFVESAAPER